MDAPFSQEDGVEQRGGQYRRLQSETLECEIPKKPENRSPTDRPWIYVFIVALIILIPFLTYTLTKLGRLSGSDSCGNFCGYKNEKYEGWECTGKDYTHQKYEILTGSYEVRGISILGRKCVSSCPNYTMPILNKCIPTDRTNSAYSDEAFIDSLQKTVKDLVSNWGAILLSTMVSCLFSFGVLLLFRYAVDFVVWFILCGSVVILHILFGFSWYGLFRAVVIYDGDTCRKFFLPVIFFYFTATTLCTVVTHKRRSIKLIIALFKEATKAIFEIPSMVLLPVFMSLLMTMMLLVFILLTLFMLMAGKLTEIEPDYYAYRFDIVMLVTIVYNFFIYVWFFEFVYGSQHIVLVGAVASWFFKRNKHQLDSTVWTSFINFIRFHLGTVALGSLILALFRTVLLIIKAFVRYIESRWLFSRCFIVKWIIYFSENAYIHTAIHGQPFFKSGKSAAKLILSNAVHMTALKSIGQFVLTLAMILLVLASSGAGILIAKTTGDESYLSVAVVCAIIATHIAIIFFCVFKASIDCIFICFCEDMTLNDGTARPYFMSKRLMQFIEDSKAIITNNRNIN